MQLRAIVLGFCLMAGGHIFAMKNANLQPQSFFHIIPPEIVSKILWMDNPSDTVCAVLRLQASCRLWGEVLDIKNIKKMVSGWVKEKEEAFDPSTQLHSMLIRYADLCQALSNMTSLDERRSNQRNAIKLSSPELYLLAGADVKYSNVHGQTALIVASKMHNADTYLVPYLKSLIKKGALINHQDKEGNSALHYASKNSAEHCVTLLLQYGADGTLKNGKQKVPQDCVGDHHPFSMHGGNMQQDLRIICLFTEQKVSGVNC